MGVSETAPLFAFWPIAIEGFTTIAGLEGGLERLPVRIKGEDGRNANKGAVSETPISTTHSPGLDGGQ